MDRKTYIGGSDIAAILGISKWKTAYGLWLDKTGQAEDEPSSEQRERVLARGKRLEPVVLDMLAEETGIEITARNQRYIDADLPFLACEIDAESGDTNIEIKTVHPFAARDWGDEGTDEIPVYYTAQVMHGLAITRRRECIVAALIGADDLRIHRVEYDAEAAELIRDKARWFWTDCVLGGVAPEPASLDDVRRMFARDTGSEIVASGDVRSAVLRLKGISEQVKMLESEADELKTSVQAYIGTNAVLIGLDGKKIATWKTQQRSALDQKALAAAHPEIVEQFKRVSESRVFRLA
jgi:putative phage-type endonuclease